MKPQPLPDLRRPRVMGILNVTPDSFSDGGRFTAVEAALEQAHAMAQAGADVIDVGGESTRPGAAAVDAVEELERVMPVIEGLRKQVELPISIDTSKAEVMTAACDAGATLINDVRALREAGALAAAADAAERHSVSVCLMHMQGEPRTMQAAPHYDDVTGDVIRFLDERVDVCRQAGIADDRIVLDPGFGFGKTLEHNLALLAGLPQLVKRGFPVLVGLSRKSMFGQLLDAPVQRRLAASVAGAVLALERGATVLRVHDVEETVHARRLFEAVRAAQV